ncbi:GNAT family N-acetyltransferase [Telluribacter sp.]|jgi:N-acetylglutamate synthase-like GNAT family acetyltransferase|uniref:GNAT family N-acetyltransferase n=1 Tax=Telluribacter sp. TaxID=1978767 RepID=UPI002E14EA52|nr:GNAT family N-acetyltransferase [Telluribacter sp.]
MEIKLTDATVRLRPVVNDDLEVLCSIYASTRQEEMKKVPQWSAALVTAFLKQQFNAQHDYYQKNYVGADFWVIEKQGQVVGRLYVQENFQNREVRIIDISLLPDWRNRGIGAAILKDIMNEATRLQRPLTIHVESFNPAKGLYERLGFKKVSETNGVYHLMEWCPTTN